MENYEIIQQLNMNKLSQIRNDLFKKFKENNLSKDEAILIKYIEFTLHYMQKGCVGIYRAYNSKSKYILEIAIFHKDFWDFWNHYKIDFKNEGFKLHKFENGEWIEYVEVEKVLSFLPNLYKILNIIGIKLGSNKV